MWLDTKEILLNKIVIVTLQMDRDENPGAHSNPSSEFRFRILMCVNLRMIRKTYVEESFQKGVGLRNSNPQFITYTFCSLSRKV